MIHLAPVNGPVAALQPAPTGMRFSPACPEKRLWAGGMEAGEVDPNARREWITF
jgi:hypothetical protein